MIGKEWVSLNPLSFIDEEDDAPVSMYDFESALLTEHKLTHVLHFPEQPFIIQGLIPFNTITLVNGPRGGGKTWFVEMMANEVTWRGSLGPWAVVNPVNTLLIDGEMSMKMIQERLILMNQGRGDVNSKPASLYVYSEAWAYQLGIARSSILDSMWRERMKDIIMRHQIKLLVLDNLASLAPGIDENDKFAFDPVSRWLLELRFEGVSIVMTHHTGKQGQQRGTSAHEDHVDTSLMLKLPKGYQSHMGCKFICEVTKDRGYMTEGMRYELSLVTDAQGKTFFSYTDTNDEGLSTVDRAMRILEEYPGMSWKEAEANHGIKKNTFYRAKRELELDE